MKKIGLMTLVMTALLLFTLTFTVSASAPAPPHPRVEHALEALRSARDHMAHAEGEFHGHRDKAIEHIDAAIHEAEICMNEP
jgi:hypothetical protein